MKGIEAYVLFSQQFFSVQHYVDETHADKMSCFIHFTAL